MQTTLLGLAIALILALVAALIGPFFIDWNQFRPQFEAEASKVVGAPVRVAGSLDARLLPTPTLRLGSVVIGGPDDLGRIRADKLDVEFSLGDLMRGEWRANELTVNGLALDLGLDQQGRVDWPASNGSFNFASLAIDRLNLTGRVALHDAASRSTLELNDIAFSGDVRSLAGALRGDGSFVVDGTRYPFRVSSGPSPDGKSNRVHLSLDSAERPVSVDLDGLLSFANRAPKFDGTLVLATPPQKKGEETHTPWRLTTKVKADHAGAQLEQIEASYGAEDRAVKLAGLGDVRFGTAPLLHASLSARQVDADKLFASDTARNDAVAQPARLPLALHTLLQELPHAPIRTRIEASTEQIMLGARPLQNVSIALRGDPASWAIDRLDFRAPGTTQISFTSSAATSVPGGSAGVLDIDSQEPDVLLGWLQGRNDVVHRTQKPLRIVGDVSVAQDRIAIDGLNAELDGGTVEGHIALRAPRPPRGTRVEAVLKAERLDLDAATAFLRTLAGPDAAWPDEAAISLDIGQARSAGQELKPLVAKFGYGPKTLSLDELKMGTPSGATIEGSGTFDRTDTTGHLTLAASGSALNQITGMLAPVAPAVASRLEQVAAAPGPVKLKLQLDIGKSGARKGHADAHAAIDLSAPQISGTATATASPELAAVRTFDLTALSRSDVKVETKLSAARADELLALLGLDHAVAGGDGAAQFEGSLSGAWHAPLQLSGKLWGAGIDAEAQGTAEPWARSPTASVNLKVRSVNLAPLFGLKPADPAAQNIRLFTRATLSGNKLALDGIDSVAAGSRLRGRLAVTLDDDHAVDGAIGLDTIDLAPAFALAIGAAGRDPTEPLGTGLMTGWHGRVTFEALRGGLAGGGELRPISGAIKSDGQSLTFEQLKGKIGGGEAVATIDVRPDPNGVVVNSRVDFSGVDGAALRYRGLKMPSGRASLTMTLMSRGRSVAALAGGLSGSGTMTLESASIPGLDPRVFDVAIRASDAGQITDDNKLRQLIAPVMAAGSLPVKTAQIPFNIRDGRLRIDATTLESTNAHVIISGGYDMLADQADVRLSFSANSIGSPSSRPEIQLFAAGTPDALNPMLDVTPLSSWLAVRTIDRETRRLDAIERGEAPPPPRAPQAGSPAVPPSTAALPAPPSVARPVQPPSGQPAEAPRRAPPRAALPQHAPAVLQPAPPVVSQQAAPLPPPIEVRPAPGYAPPRPRPSPRPPLVLTPPVNQ